MTNCNFRKFKTVWRTAEAFLADYKASGIYSVNSANRLSDDDAKLTYYLLQSRYNGSTVAVNPLVNFKRRVFALMFQFGPSWVKRLDIQSKLRGLTEAEITQANKVIYNHAYNPGTEPSTGTLEELTAINDQNVSNMKKAKTDAYYQLFNIITLDVTEEYIARFKNLFMIVYPPTCEADEYTAIVNAINCSVTAEITATAGTDFTAEFHTALSGYTLRGATIAVTVDGNLYTDYDYTSDDNYITAELTIPGEDITGDISIILSAKSTDGLYPSNTLYPSTTLYPKGE